MLAHNALVLCTKHRNNTFRFLLLQIDHVMMLSNPIPQLFLLLSSRTTCPWRNATKLVGQTQLMLTAEKPEMNRLQTWETCCSVKINDPPIQELTNTLANLRGYMWTPFLQSILSIVVRQVQAASQTRPCTFNGAMEVGSHTIL